MLAHMEMLVTTDDLLEFDPSLDADDPRIDMVVEKAIEVVLFKGDPKWTVETVPGRARTICLIVARRELVNPDHETSSGASVISSRVTDAEAAGLMLTDLEVEELREMAGRGPVGGGGGLWRLSLVDRTPPDPPAWLTGANIDAMPMLLGTPEGMPYYYPLRG